MNISYDAYKVFYYVAQHRSFTKAAQMLYSNQPNVTRTIKHLEQALGCTLFTRSNRGVALTPEGEKLFSHISVAMEQIRAGEETLHADANLQGGVISIGTSEIALHHTLLPVLKEFRRHYPGIRLRIFNSTTRQAVSALKDWLVDLSLVTTPLESFGWCHCRELTTFRETAICSSTFQIPEPEPLSWEDLTRYPLICLGKGSVTYELYASILRSQGLVLAPDVETATSDQIVPMVRADLGIGFVPEHTAAQAAKDGSIRILRLREALPQRSICLLKRKDMPLSIAARELEKMILLYETP